MSKGVINSGQINRKSQQLLGKKKLDFFFPCYCIISVSHCPLGWECVRERTRRVEEDTGCVFPREETGRPGFEEDAVLTGFPTTSRKLRRKPHKQLFSAPEASREERSIMVQRGPRTMLWMQVQGAQHLYFLFPRKSQGCQPLHFSSCIPKRMYLLIGLLLWSLVVHCGPQSHSQRKARPPLA